MTGSRLNGGDGRDRLDHPVQDAHHHEDDPHEAGDPTTGLPRVTENQRRVLVTRGSKDQRDRDDQRNVVQQVGR